MTPRARIRALYGEDLPVDAGVLHVIACWRPPSGPLRALRIGAATPRSAADRFVLNLARARADAIVTTGRILREEPEVTHALAGGPEDVAALLRFRRDALGRMGPARSVVLTSGRELDLGHPLFAAAPSSLVFTTEEAARRLAPAAGSRGIEVVARSAPGIRDCVTWLRETGGARTICVEAGPGSARALYAAPLTVDELALSIFEEPVLVEAARGPEFLAESTLGALLPRASQPTRVHEPSGRWSFRRLRRASDGASPGR